MQKVSDRKIFQSAFVSYFFPARKKKDEPKKNVEKQNFTKNGNRKNFKKKKNVVKKCKKRSKTKNALDSLKSATA